MKVRAGSRGGHTDPPHWEECLGQCQTRMWDQTRDGDHLWTAVCPVTSRTSTRRSVRAGGAGVPSERWVHRVRCVQPGLVPAWALCV